jgi:hypothetical protein
VCQQCAYPNVVSVDEELRHDHVAGLHPLPDLLLRVPAHEDVALLELDQQRPQDLFDLDAPKVGRAHHPHRRCVHHQLALLLLFEILQTKIKHDLVHTIIVISRPQLVMENYH